MRQCTQSGCGNAAMHVVGESPLVNRSHPFEVCDECLSELRDDWTPGNVEIEVLASRCLRAEQSPEQITLDEIEAGSR